MSRDLMTPNEIRIFVANMNPDEIVTEEEYASRMSNCASCEWNVPRDGGIDRCTKCNCVLAIKGRAKKASCPIGNW